MASGYYIRQCISRAHSHIIGARKQKPRSDLDLASKMHNNRECINEAKATSVGKQGFSVAVLEKVLVFNH